MLWLVINLQHLTPNILPHKIPVRLSYLIKARPKILLFHKDVGAKCWCLSVLQRRGVWGEQPAMHLQAQRGKARDGRVQSTCLAAMCSPAMGPPPYICQSWCQIWVQDSLCRAGTVLVALPTRAGSKDQLAPVFRSINLYLYFAQLKVAQIDY